MSASGTTTDRPTVTLGLSPEEQSLLLDLAEAAVAQALGGDPHAVPDLRAAPDRLLLPGASFVTLRSRDGRLLGCIGSLTPHRPLALDVASHAVDAGFADPRFTAITATEWSDCTLEVSVLGPQRELQVSSYPALVRALRPGIDGLVVEAPAHRATFLPAVWESVQGPEDFCALLWRKAGLWPGDWPPGVRVATYQVDAFSRPGPHPEPAS